MTTPGVCNGSCKACGVLRAHIEELFHRLAGMMTEEEFSTLAEIIANVNARTDD